MKIVGVSACTVGIAHTYMAQQKLEDAAKAAGDEVKIETQGTIGVENELTAQDIADADIVILAIDIKSALCRQEGRQGLHRDRDQGSEQAHRQASRNRRKVIAFRAYSNRDKKTRRNFNEEFLEGCQF